MKKTDIRDQFSRGIRVKLILRRTIRKTFLLEGETVTMRYVKQLRGEERYTRIIEDAKKKFFADPTIDLCYPTP